MQPRPRSSAPPWLLALALGAGCSDETAGNIGPGGAANRFSLSEAGTEIEIENVVGSATMTSSAAPTFTAVMAASLSGGGDAPATGWRLEVDLDLNRLFRGDLPFDATADLRTGWTAQSGTLVATSTPTAGSAIDGGRLRRICAACSTGAAVQSWSGNLRVLYVDANRFEGRMEMVVDGGFDTAPSPSRTLAVSAYFDVPVP
ncbi:MAG: hypothetical protein AAFU79_08490 [Myxococcota bacterium]